MATGIPVAMAALYLLLLAVAAFFHRPQAALGAPTTPLVVLVPAHDESALIGRCVASLLAQDYPPALFRVVVIADNCIDDTASRAAAAGAEVLVRDAPSALGKGRALSWAIDHVLTRDPSAAAIVVVDADSIADPGMLAGLEAHFVRGAGAVQAEYLVLEEPGTRSQLRAAAFLLFHRTRFSGRAALGMACFLAGNGMLLSRPVLEQTPWRAWIGAEDLEYTLDLRLAGTRPCFAAEARVHGPAPTAGAAARTQRLRWEGGRFYLIRTRLLGLLTMAVRLRDWSLLDAAADLAVPPLGMLALVALAGTSTVAALVFVHAVGAVSLVPWLVGLVSLCAFVIVGLRAAHAPASMYRALMGAPLFLLAKIGTYLRLARGLNADHWDRSERPGEGPAGGGRVNVAGVPIDRVDMAGAVDRIMDAVEARRFLHVCTVNLQYLVLARQPAGLSQVLESSELNVPDGAPVVWLARLLGQPLPERVAGIDLAVELMAEAARRGTRVFLLGGGNGSAATAANILRARYPGLVVCGTLEPPHKPIDRLDNAAIIRAIRESHAEILLVAMNVPKQDWWIHVHRDQLGDVTVIGVGCTLDVIAGHRRRAPVWMQRSGLEWFFRVVHEPRRLASRYGTQALWLLGVLVPQTAWRRLAGMVTTSPALVTAERRAVPVTSAEAPMSAATRTAA